MELKLNDCVRTKHGIAKIIDLKENPYGEKTIYVLDKKIIDVYECESGVLVLCNPLIETMQDKFDTKFGDEKLVIKSSPNIIDLIEVGDMVKVEDFGWVRVSIKFETLKFFDADGTEWLYDEIESIVTKEQMEAMEYKIER